MKKKQISRICIVDTVYTLFFYYLNYSIDEINHTFFFISEGLPNLIRKKLPQYYFFKKRKTVFQRLLFRLSLRISSHFRWSFLQNKPIYGLDHLTFSSGIIGNKTYTLLEDAPYIASFYFNSLAYKKNIKQRASKVKCFFIDLLFGRVFLRPFGVNSQCKQIVFSKNDLHPTLLGKNIQIKSLEQLWDGASEQKKETILQLFDINNDDIAFLSSKSIIIFTQPLFKDNITSEEEQVQIYDEIIKQYPAQEVLLKPHPRDSIDYSFYFPNIAIIRKNIPSQLLDLLDIKFKKAVTISSSSVLSFHYDIEIDWIGTKIHPKIEAAWGEIQMPNLTHAH